MKKPSPSFIWHAGPAAWGSALIAGFGCALPLLLGLFSGHPGFFWASLGAFHAAQANPMHRLGMLRMLMLCILGACSTGLGFWAGEHYQSSFILFAAFGLLLAWLQRFGKETGKFAVSLVICLSLGQSQLGLSSLHNPNAVAVLFILGGLWVMLLAFGLRGLHGLRMWPYMPRFISIIKVLMRHSQSLPQTQWRLHALSCTLALGLCALVVNLTNVDRGYWLTLTVLATLQVGFYSSLQRALLAILGSLSVAVLLILLGHSLQSPTLMVSLLLPLIILSRAWQANHYGLFMLQSILCSVLLAECLALDWHVPEVRLLNSLTGVAVALAVALLIHGLQRWLQHRLSRQLPSTE
ncbi:FUSC family protein [Pseudomonas sp. 5P_3.1_Bac2]|uniref:FUSC family protein n=1 Tax=Pseudomonas sp. 5P_3.1_Bac2 TaxID=2971617 RepID=UPI0021C963C3|nr:FUSC family protein [Pseudomonas sp. 5P_3.1_Bac2]MCU1716549.1 FUSC family protein [Pseudomonas sp. 5P_3.1_Bac2]